MAKPVTFILADMRRGENGDFRISVRGGKKEYLFWLGSDYFSRKGLNMKKFMVWGG